MKESQVYRRVLTRMVGLIGVLALAAVVLPSQVGILGDAVRTLVTSDKAYIGLGIVGLLLSYCTAAAAYVWLAFRPVRFNTTLLVQIADGFTNRLLPASLGGVATNVLYLAWQRHTKSQAALVVTVNNLLGFFGHVIVLVVLLAFQGFKSDVAFSVNGQAVRALAIVLGGFIVIGLVVSVVYGHQVSRYVLRSFRDVRNVIGRPQRLLAALLFSMATTLSYALILYCATLAVNVHISFLQIFLALTATVMALAVTPTPGGVGGAELGLTAALASMGVNAQQALSTALLFRLITFWLPIVPGFITLQIAISKGVLQTLK